jgi:hypothetical protein
VLFLITPVRMIRTHWFIELVTESDHARLFSLIETHNTEDHCFMRMPTDEEMVAVCAGGSAIMLGLAAICAIAWFVLY